MLVASKFPILFAFFGHLPCFLALPWLSSEIVVTSLMLVLPRYNFYFYISKLYIQNLKTCFWSSFMLTCTFLVVLQDFFYFPDACVTSIIYFLIIFFCKIEFEKPNFVFSVERFGDRHLSQFGIEEM